MISQKHFTHEPVQIRSCIEATLAPAELQAFNQFKNKCCESSSLDHSNTASRDNRVGIKDDVTLLYVFLQRPTQKRADKLPGGSYVRASSM
jgi:hypothetical protein